MSRHRMPAAPHEPTLSLVPTAEYGVTMRRFASTAMVARWRLAAAAGVAAAGAIALVGALAPSAPANVRRAITIAYSGSAHGADDIYVVRPDGSHKRLLIPSASAPAWSRDGQQIAYNTEDRQVGIARADGTKRRTLSIAGGKFCDTPSWSPNGREIVCGEDSPTAPAGADSAQALYIADVRSGHSRMLVAGGAEPAWSPDGARIAYVGVADSGLEMIDLRTHAITNLGSGSEPSWSPDGKKIAYSTLHAIAVMNADESGWRMVAQSQKGLGDPSWSPDGSHIVFDEFGRSSRRLFVVRADGSHRRLLVRGGVDGDWRPR